MALKACRENDKGGKLHCLVTKLLGTESAKKVQTAIDSWRKTMKKEQKGEKADKAKAKDTEREDYRSQYYQFQPPQFQPPQFQPPWYRSPRPSFRPRGFRGGRRPWNQFPRFPAARPFACFLCNSLDHFVKDCPQHNSQKVKTE
jgi:hypothetical protein